MTVAPSGKATSTGGDQDRTEFRNTVRVVLDRWSRGNQGQVQLRLAVRSDLSVLCALNAKSILDLGRDGLFMPMSESFLTAMVLDGAILVPEREGEALGYSIAVPAGNGRSPFVPTLEPQGTGLLFGTALDPALRGQGWHPRLIRIRKKIFAEAGFASVQSTVSPFNTVSLANLMNAGFHVVGLKNLLDGHPRFLLRHEIQSPSEPTGNLQSVVLPQSGDLSEHEAFLANGFIATGLKKDRTYALLYSEGEGQRYGGLDP